MRGHIHTDGLHAIYIVGVAIIGFHALRGLGAFLAAHGAPDLGSYIGGLVTFNGG